MSNNSIYRAVPKNKHVKEKLIKPYATMRPPGNVPYIVDNLWEWVRPFEYPNRRYAAFASPTPELASEAVYGECDVYRVEFSPGTVNKICQLLRPEKNHKDSKFHQECSGLKKIINKILDKNWFSKDLSEKQNLAGLWTPCLKQDEIEAIFQNSDLLRDQRDGIFNSINYWNDVVLLDDPNAIPDNQGEIFFEYPDGYYLQTI